MNKNINIKIFDNNLTKNSKLVTLKTKPRTDLGNIKYFPSFSKEWKNIIYSFNKNNLKDLPMNDVNINKLIKSYFSLFFKDSNYLGLTRSIRISKRRTFLNRIFISNIEVKHTNQKAKITLYTINKEKKSLQVKHNKILNQVNLFLLDRYIDLYKVFLQRLLSLKNVFQMKTIKVEAIPSLSVSQPASLWAFKKKYFFFHDEILRKSDYINYKLQSLRFYLALNRLFLEKAWSVMVKTQYQYSVKLLKKFDQLYSVNQFKFNNKKFLPKLSKLLLNIIGNKKIQYNIVNLKSITLNSDIFTNIVALNIKKRQNKKPVWSMLGIINRTQLPNVNTIQEKMRIEAIDNLDRYRNKYQDLKIVSNVNNKNNNLDKLLNDIFKHNTINENYSLSLYRKAKNDDNSVKNIVFKSIGYKNMAGVRLEAKGRLTRRYRADRAIYTLKWKGGLKNVYSSFRGLSSVLFRGNTHSNVSYSISKSTRRIGAFAVKGWVAGK